MKVSLLAAALTASMASFAQAEPSRLRVDGGLLVGEEHADVVSFKGVPYAKPPVGNLRWRPPERAAWKGDRGATQYGAACPQPINADGTPNGGGVTGRTSEDCLFLNVWAPKGAKNAPIMVFVHGGAGYLGSGNVPRYDGTAFARDGVILVTINYRLGMLGQFAHPALTNAAKPNEPLANFQLMDAVAALEWVRRNADALGGDRNNVTLFGQSAGAVIVAALLSTPSSKGLFNKAIIQSGVPQFGGGRTLAQAEADGERFAEVLGLGAAATPEKLRSLPLERVVSADARGPGFSNGSYLIIDGRFRTTTTGAGFENGATVDVPLIVGSNSAEFFGPEAYRMAQTAARHGKAAAWQYMFTYVPTWRRAEQPTGAPHSAELGYVFNTVEDPIRGAPSRILDQDRKVAEQVHACWVAFARAPTSSEALSCNGLTWPSRTAENDALVLFDAVPSVAKAKPIIAAVAAAFPARPGLGEPAN